MLLIGDDWAEDHHDIEIEDEAGRRLARAGLPEGLEGMTRLYALVAEHAPAGWAELAPMDLAAQVVVGIETDRGPVGGRVARGWLSGTCDKPDVDSALPRAARDVGHRERCWRCTRVSRDCPSRKGPPSTIAGDNELADAVKLLDRAHQTAIWERTRQVLRLRSTLREYFPRGAGGLRGSDRQRHIDPAGNGTEPGVGREAEVQPTDRRAALGTARRHHVEAKAVELQQV